VPGGTFVLRNLRNASDEMILAEAMIYFVFVGTVALAATLLAHLF
jgi:hypothetical protein